ncbi:GTP-binding protein [Scytonema sp. UIC 10036]|uniref:GTPase n=1 Tax=Scytonema sp. UIC 10036 TaxID=2304196 RepID=UPI0012DA5F7F|nr:GTPase domain-containing protein [Scytonema sp. UIC 10036]MUG91327.1 GTP-binding protein [Scytonema sp. UIC 10036]
MTEPIRVLVFGTVGTGKTSCCNTLAGKKKEVSNQARGVTFTSQVYEAFEANGKSIVLTDTAGLNESELGTVPANEAFMQLTKLLKNSNEGYNLLIQVFRASRLTILEKNNYDLFVKGIANLKIPVILVVTGCEGFFPMSQWREENREYVESSDLIYKDIICTCFAKAEQRTELEPIYARLRDESRQAVLAAIIKYATETPVKFYDSTGQDYAKSFADMLKQVWEFCRERFKWYLLLAAFEGVFVSFLVDVLEFSEEDARKIVEFFNIN